MRGVKGSVESQALGCSRGGFDTKLHAIHEVMLDEAG